METSDERVKIIIADDHGITRLGLRMLCNEVFPNAEIRDAETISELQSKLKEELPNLLILDLFIDEVNCLPIISELLNFYPELNILVITMADESLFGSRIINAGAMGYVNKLESNESFKTAIFRVCNGYKYITQNMYLNYINSTDAFSNKKTPLDYLTDKEIEIAQYLTEGYSISEISEKARLAQSTVSTYKHRIFAKLKVDNLADLIVMMKEVR